MFSLFGSTAWCLSQLDIYASLALNSRLLQIANVYLGCYSRLNHYDVWLNTPHAGPPNVSHMWHRDMGDHSMLSAFILVNDVTVQNGAFFYVLGSQPGGRLADLDAPSVHDGRAPRSNDEQMRTAVPESQWFMAAAPAGTVIFADTRGYHKGGAVSCGQRLQFMSFYSRPDYYRPPRVLFTRSALRGCGPLQRWAAR
jgi:ectoine hydroxylase-related dioxygenase (phytanoyl-CoA dioxygenase family)